MTKHEFLSQLSHKLRALPESEKRDALEYYDGYISDADNEAAAIAELGRPGEVAAIILSNYVSRPADRRPGKTGIRTAYLAILAVFALPVGVPLAAAAFSIIVALAAVVFSVVVTGVALLAAGIAVLITSPFAMMYDFWLGMFIGGLGLVSLGIGILIFKGSIKLFGVFPMVTRAVLKRRTRRAMSHTGSDSFSNPFNSSTQSTSADEFHPANSNGNRPSRSSHDDLSAAHFSRPAEEIPPAQEQTGQQYRSGYADSGYTAAVRRRRPFMRFAVLVIILGAVMFGAAWQAGSRGGQISWRDGRPSIEAFDWGQPGTQEEVYLGAERFHEVYVRTSFENIIILPADTHRVVLSNTADADVNITNGVLTITTVSRNNRNFNLIMGFGRNVGGAVRVYLPLEFFKFEGRAHGSIRERSTSGRIEIDSGLSYLIHATTTSGRIEVRTGAANAGHVYLRSTSGSININGGFSILSAATTSGRIEVGNNNNDVGHMYLRSTSGRISANNLRQVDRLEARTTSGRIELDNVSWAELNAQSVSGRINISEARVSDTIPRSDTRLSTTSGTVNVEIIGERDNFSYAIRTTSGRTRVDGTHPPRTVSRTDRAKTIDIRTVSGSITLNFTQ